MKKNIQNFVLIMALFILSPNLIAQKAGETYYIQSALAGKYLDVKWGKTDNGTPLHLWPYNGGNAQKFSLEDAGGGYFYIKSALGKYVHVQNRSSETKALALIYVGRGNDNTKWRFIPGPNGYHYIQSKKGTYLDVQWGRSADGTPIWMWTLNRGTAQQWKLKNVASPYIVLNTKILTSAMFFQSVADAQTNSTQRKNPQGPDFDVENLPLFSNLDADLPERFNHNSTSKFSRLNSILIKDKEPLSGVFYYIPRSYSLDWDSDVSEHQLRINYSRNSGEREARSAQVNATLTSGITLKEINFMEDMIREDLKNRNVPNPKVELKPLPVDSPTIVFNGAGSSIASDQISIVAFSDFSEDIEMSFTTSDDDIDALKTSLQNKLPFSLHFKSSADNEQAYDIPASISIKDEESYGIFEVDFPALQNAKNPTPFPIMAQYLHVLTTTNTSEGLIPYIYSFEMGNKTVQPNDIIKFNKPTGFRLPSQLRAGGKPIRAFVEYKLLECDACFRDIINELTGGLTAATKQKVTFRPVNLIRSTGAEFVWIKMRSKQLDPRNQRVITTYDPIEISDDSNGVESPTLFLFDSQPPKFEYQVELVMPNGEEYVMDHWIEGNQLAVRLSSHKLKEHFNSWPSNTTDLEEEESGEEGGNK